MRGNRTFAFYSLLIYFLAGIVIVQATVFTYIDNFERISFSVRDNDIQEGYPPEYGIYDNGNYALFLDLDLKKDTINYLRIKVDDIKDHDPVLVFVGYDDDWNAKLIIRDIHLHTGNNDIQLTSKDFSIAVLSVFDCDKNTVCGVEFRQSVKKIDYQGAIPYAAGALLIYTFLYTLLIISIKRLANKTQTYCFDYNKINDPYYSQAFTYQNESSTFLSNVSFGDLVAKCSRIILLTTMIVLSLLLEIKDKYFTLFYNYLGVQLGVILVITLLLIGKNASNTRLKPDRFSFLVWLCFTSYSLVSDVVVNKELGFALTAIFLVLVFYAFRGNKRDCLEEIFADLEIAIQFFLVLLVIASIGINRDFSSTRYSGPIENPSVYALYLGTIWATLLGGLENHIRRKGGIIKRSILIFEMAITAFLAVASQSMTPLIAMIAITILFCFRLLSIKKGRRFAIKMTCFVIFLLIGILAGIAVSLRMGVISSDSRLAQKITSSGLTTLLSGRDYYWRAYLADMNLFGHSARPILWGHKRLPHNAVIGMAYKYGVPIIIPYVVLMIRAVEKTYKYAEQEQTNSTVPLYCVVVFIIMSMADNVEQPFVWLPWIACYLMMAPILIMPVEGIKVLKIANKRDYAKESE